MITISIIFNSILLGAGLAMDAFSVSIANTLAEPTMKKLKMVGIAGTFSFFQFIMPFLGWLCVHAFVERFQMFAVFIPYIAFLLLAYIGGKMIWETVKKQSNQTQETVKKLNVGTLLVQGVATSIDALSVGFTIEQYSLFTALIACAVIGIVTFAICALGLLLGRKFSKYFSKAELLGGIILITIGLEILLKGIFTK